MSKDNVCEWRITLEDNVCEWRITLKDWTGTYYEGSCGHRFHDNRSDASDANGKICPECKKLIRVIDPEEDEDG